MLGSDSNGTRYDFDFTSFDNCLFRLLFSTLLFFYVAKSNMMIVTLDKAHVLHRQLGLRAGAGPRDLEERKAKGRREEVLRTLACDDACGWDCDRGHGASDFANTSA